MPESDAIVSTLNAVRPSITFAGSAFVYAVPAPMVGTALSSTNVPLKNERSPRCASMA